MGRLLRYVPPGSLVEITVRTAEGRMLLKPVQGLGEITTGIMARGSERYPVRLHAHAFLSNHYHLLMSPEDAYAVAAFMKYLNTNLSKEVKRIHNFQFPLFDKRYDLAIITQEEVKQVERLRYILSQGVKEDLVENVTDWPGAHCARSLLTGKPDQGVWFDRSRQWWARKRGKPAGDADVASFHLLHLYPLPCWDHLASAEVQHRTADLITDIEAEARYRREKTGKTVLGLQGIYQQDPFATKEDPEPRPRIMIHSATQELRLAYLEAYSTFENAYRRAAKKLKAGISNVAFPEGSFPPFLPFVRAGP
jgi:REP element-mobilizing transposase RayT